MLSSKWWNIKTSDIKLVCLYSAMKMMHIPINLRFDALHLSTKSVQNCSWKNGVLQSLCTLGKIRLDRRAQNQRFWIIVKYRQRFKEERSGLIESVWQAMRQQCNQLLVKQNKLELSEKTSTSSEAKQDTSVILLEGLWYLYCRTQKVLHFQFMRLNTTLSILTF
jgi:hypothetical protein